MIEMNQSHWTEADRAEAVLRPVTSDLVAEKVRDMDGVHATDLYLRDGDEPEVYLAVARGADERYVVFISRHNAEFVQATTPDAGPGTFEIVVGGQRGRYAAADRTTWGGCPRQPLDARSSARRRPYAGGFRPRCRKGAGRARRR